MKTRLLIISGIFALILVMILLDDAGFDNKAYNPNENKTSFIRIADDKFVRQSLTTGESLGDTNNVFGWFGLIMILFVVFAYVIVKIKKQN